MSDVILEFCRYNELDELREYLSSYSDEEKRKILVSTSEEYGNNTGLHYASVNGNVEIVEYLLQFLLRHDINIRNSNGNTALHWSCLNGQTKVVGLLLDAGADYRIRNDKDRTPLFEAESANHVDVVKLLLEKYTETDLEETQETVGETVDK
jgi:ankyrin repeat protein